MAASCPQTIYYGFLHWFEILSLSYHLGRFWTFYSVSLDCLSFHASVPYPFSQTLENVLMPDRYCHCSFSEFSWWFLLVYASIWILFNYLLWKNVNISAKVWLTKYPLPSCNDCQYFICFSSIFSSPLIFLEYITAIHIISSLSMLVCVSNR